LSSSTEVSRNAMPSPIEASR